MNERFRRNLSVFVVIIFFVITNVSMVNSGDIQQKSSENEDNNSFSNGYIDLNVWDVWNLTNNISNGIQIPIDVRTDSEWYEERIDTPFPEDPRHYCLDNLKDEEGLQQFMSMFEGQEVIMYCRIGGRSSTAAQILINNNFNGTVYNMMGGILGWKNAGLPTKKHNDPPLKPMITGKKNWMIKTPCVYHVNASDPNDDAVRYGWDWNGDDIVDEWTGYYKCGIEINVTHIWNFTGEYTVKAIVEDRVGDQSVFSSPLNVTIEPTDTFPPLIKISKPQKCLYINNRRIIPFFTAVIIGPIDIKLTGSDEESGLDKICLYIDNELKLCNYTWNDEGFGRHTIKAVAHDQEGNTATDTLKIWKIL